MAFYKKFDPMNLVPCKACDHKISPLATSCPNCGHPLAGKKKGPTCYACSETATQKCQDCETGSCIDHLTSYASQHGSKLLCSSCGETQKGWNALAYIIAGIGLIVFFIVLSQS